VPAAGAFHTNYVIQLASPSATVCNPMMYHDQALIVGTRHLKVNKRIDCICQGRLPSFEGDVR
jgi:hypothetical protein